MGRIRQMDAGSLNLYLSIIDLRYYYVNNNADDIYMDVQE